MKIFRTMLPENAPFAPIRRHKSVLRFRRNKEHRYERRKAKEWIHRYELFEPEMD